VPEDVAQQPAVPRPEPAEVALRDLAAREVVFPEKAQEGRLQGPKPAVFQAPSHEAAARVEEVQVGKAFQGVRESVHDEPGGQEVEVEGLAVEGDEGLPRRRQLRQVGQGGPLFRVVPEEELLEDEAASLEPAQADQESHGPSSPARPVVSCRETEVPDVQGGQVSHIPRKRRPGHVNPTGPPRSDGPGRPAADVLADHEEGAEGRLDLFSETTSS
jgi:hypothetical protein